MGMTGDWGGVGVGQRSTYNHHLNKLASRPFESRMLYTIYISLLYMGMVTMLIDGFTVTCK